MAEVEEMIARKVCPDCHTANLRVEPDYISCKACGCHGNPKEMKWCLKVPVFNPADATTEGQVYEDAKGAFWKMMGYAPGCGREVKGDFCTSCRSFLPFLSDHVAKRRAKSLRV